MNRYYHTFIIIIMFSVLSCNPVCTIDVTEGEVNVQKKWPKMY